MIRHDFVSNSSSSSFFIGYTSKEAQEKFAKKCKGNREYGIISDLMYDNIMQTAEKDDYESFKDDFNEEIDKCPIVTRHTENTSEYDDESFADLKILDILQRYNESENENDGVYLLYEQRGW